MTESSSSASTSSSNIVRGGASKKESLPRYARVNTLRCTFADVKRAFAETGHVLQQPAKLRAGKKEKWRRAKPDVKVDRKTYTVDPHIPNLLVFPPHSNLGKHALVASGAIMLQDKASCFASQALNPPPGSFVIDACAAPGSKTSHLAALMNNKGSITAFDKDANRIESLKRVLARAGATCVQVVHQSFLDCSPNTKQLAPVTHVLVDPSCSGSGMNLDWSRKPQKDAATVRQLAENQKQLVLHAMKFPSVQVVVYSTCSVHDEENEDVVAAVLQANSNFELAPALPQWPTRGKPLFPHAEFCMRTCKEDRTIGFFVARFVRNGGPFAVLQTPASSSTASMASPLAFKSAAEQKTAAADHATVALADEPDDALMDDATDASALRLNAGGESKLISESPPKNSKKRQRSSKQESSNSSSSSVSQLPKASSSPNPRKERRRLRKKQKRNAIGASNASFSLISQ